eukprot:gene4394-8748_t
MSRKEVSNLSFVKVYSTYHGTWQNIMLMAPIFQIILTALSLKWTWDLIQRQMYPKTKKPE